MMYKEQNAYTASVKDNDDGYEYTFDRIALYTVYSQMSKVKKLSILRM